jgi:hypothetical protein
MTASRYLAALPLTDPICNQNYALSTLQAQLRESADQSTEEMLERRFDVWCRLLAAYSAPSSVFGSDPAAASDLYALVTLFMADLDLSCMIDFYGRLLLASGLAAGMPAGTGPTIDPALQTEFQLNGSYTDRIAAVWKDLIMNGCENGGQQACGVLHDLWHPSYRALIP